jgi:hypothetical protein
LLLKHQKWFVERWVAFADLFPENAHLRVLTAETQDSHSGDVRVMNVSSQQAAKIVGIFASSSTAAFMHQKLNAVNILKNSILEMTRGRKWTVSRCVGLDFA